MEFHTKFEVPIAFDILFIRYFTSAVLPIRKFKDDPRHLKSALNLMNHPSSLLIFFLFQVRSHVFFL